MSEQKLYPVDKDTKVIHTGKWIIDKDSDLSIDCYVTEDERRILSLRGTARAMGLTGGGSNALIRNLKSNYLQPYLSEDLILWIQEVEAGRLMMIKGIRVNFLPFDATLLVDLCKAYISAKNDGIFEGQQWEKQSQMADKLLAIMTAFAKVGIIALIDEVTGYQVERKKDELQKLLAEFVRKEYLPWTRRFPEEFYLEVYRLKNWDYNGNSKTPLVGKITNYLVYDLMPEGVLEELQKRNPIVDKIKRRKFKHHQYLSESTGISYLDKHLVSIIALMRACDSWDDFDRLFRRSFKLDVSQNVGFDVVT